MHSKTKSKEKMKVRSLTPISPCPKSHPSYPLGSFAPESNFIFIFLDITVLREKLKKEQMERERYENEANHQSRKVKIF